jgi:hypothetical protein
VVQLGADQAQLVMLLAERMLVERHRPTPERGFVRGSELLGTLAWGSLDPVGDSVRQLVLLTRQQLVRAGVGDLIEVSPRFGYRLRVSPR